MTEQTEATPEATTEATPKPAGVKFIERVVEEGLRFPFDKLVVGKNVRSTLPSVTDLVASIEREGILEPLLAVMQADGFAKVIAGHRRYHAAKALGMKFLPVRFIEADDDRSRRVALIENLQREDMNPLDKAQAIADMIASETMEQRHAAKALGVSDGFISQHLALLRLPKKAQAALRSGSLELAHARQLGRVKDEDAMMEFLKLAPGLTSAALSDKVDAYLQKEKEKAEKAEKAAKKKTRAKAKNGAEEDDEEADAEPTLADLYAAKKLEPLKKTDMTEALKFYANKLERAEADSKKAEYKWILRGLEIASGLFEFTP